jgi:hypothetical protein
MKYLEGFSPIPISVWEAWNAVPDSYIQTLLDSWWERCQAVVNARGGPTKY